MPSYHGIILRPMFVLKSFQSLGFPLCFACLRLKRKPPHTRIDAHQVKLGSLLLGIRQSSPCAPVQLENISTNIVVSQREAEKSFPLVFSFSAMFSAMAGAAENGGIFIYFSF